MPQWERETTIHFQSFQIMSDAPFFKKLFENNYRVILKRPSSSMVEWLAGTLRRQIVSVGSEDAFFTYKKVVLET